MRAAVRARRETAEELWARFVGLAPGGFEEVERPDGVELAVNGETAAPVRAVTSSSPVSDVADRLESRRRDFRLVSQNVWPPDGGVSDESACDAERALW